MYPYNDNENQINDAIDKYTKMKALKHNCLENL